MRTMLTKFVLAVALIGSAAMGQDWTQVAGGPGPRTGPAMTLDAARGETVMFGGIVPFGPALDETWVWDGVSWNQRHPAHAPQVRSFAVLAYDSARGQAVLFGGITTGGSLLNDTWIWDGSDWTQRSPLTSPPARIHAAMAFDPLRCQMVLFGGSFATGFFGDTWTWNGTNWAAATPGVSPSARALHSLGFDAISGQVILYGGDSFGQFLRETWGWDGSNWNLKTPAVNPGPIFDNVATSGRIFLYAADASGSPSYWIWHGSNWIQLHPLHAARPTFPVISLDKRGNVILFGLTPGVTATTSETWLYPLGTQTLTSGVQITTSGFVFSRVTGTWVGTVTVTNTGVTPLAGPLGVVLTKLAPQLKPINSTGINVFGVPYLTLPGFDTANGQLVPGQSATVPVQFPAMTFEAVAYQGTWQ